MLKNGVLKMTIPVSYTHLDVYKRQEFECPSYSFKLIGKQEHCYIEKEFKGK